MYRATAAMIVAYRQAMWLWGASHDAAGVTLDGDGPGKLDASSLGN